MPADPATTAATYRKQAQAKRRLADRLSPGVERERLFQEAKALDDLAQTLEEAAPT